MVRLLNKKLAGSFLLLLFSALASLAQVDDKSGEKDYKDPEQFDRFYKRRKIVAAWQINKLKDGALVVKLKTNNHLLEALKRDGNTVLAEQKRLENLAVNLNMSRAFRNNYNFSKIYFIYSNYGDSLLKGKRSGIFLDSALNIDPSITMTEPFYIISESDALYNSSIGFVPEDSANKVVEQGSPTLANVPIVLKNKYGHQLKRPFPFYAKNDLVPASNNGFKVYVLINGVPIPFYLGLKTDKKDEPYMYMGNKLYLKFDKSYSYPRLSEAVSNLNDELEDLYKRARMPNVERYPEVKPFLY